MDRGITGSEIMARTVASSFPLRPYVGDQISSSMSKSLEIASREGGSKAPERVLVRTASGFCFKFSNHLTVREKKLITLGTSPIYLSAKTLKPFARCLISINAISSLKPSCTSSPSPPEIAS